MAEQELSKGVQQIVRSRGKELLGLAVETMLVAGAEVAGTVMQAVHGRVNLAPLPASPPRTVSEQELVEMARCLQEAQAQLDQVEEKSERLIRAFLASVELVKAVRKARATPEDLEKLAAVLLEVDPECFDTAK